MANEFLLSPCAGWGTTESQLRKLCQEDVVRLAGLCAFEGADFARLLARIWYEVNPPPQTLQRQPGETACVIPGTGC